MSNDFDFKQDWEACTVCNGDQLKVIWLDEHTTIAEPCDHCKGKGIEPEKLDGEDSTKDIRGSLHTES